jgi:hypothetical protein
MAQGTSEAQPHRHRCGAQIEHSVQPGADAPSEDDAGHNHAQETAVEGHAAVPHLHDVEWMGEIVQRIVEQHIAKAAANHHAQHRPQEEVVDLRAGHGRRHRAPQRRI